MPSNEAAWLLLAKASPLEVKSAPYTSPGKNEIVVKNGAVAINPIDWLIQELGNMVFSWLKYPCVIGEDVAGEVVEVGSAVTRFKVGDRVVGYGLGTSQEHNSSARCAFQRYTVIFDHMASPIPQSLSYESAAVIPLGLSTAACGLFQKDQLALQYPTVPSAKPNGKTLLIWGGSTSVACNAIQLAVAAGYEVITTCSPRNFEFVKKLGASQAFDYNSKTITNDLVCAFKGRTTAGALAIGHMSAEACLDVIDKCKGDKFISMASYPVPSPPPKQFVMLSIMIYYASHSLSNWVKAKARRIRSNYIVAHDNEDCRFIYADFLPKALAEGQFVAAPDPEIIGKGLEYIQAGFEAQKKGMSAKKVVVSL